MTATLEGAGARRDQGYQQAMAALQRGDWAQAIQLLEELDRRYPADPAVARALDEARFKAHLDSESKVRAKRYAFNARPLVRRVAFIATLLFLILVAVFIVRDRISPALADQRQQAEITSLVAAGNELVEAGKLDEAEATFQKLLELVPNHPEALAGLERSAAARDLLTRYTAAVEQEKAAAALMATTVTADGVYDAELADQARASFEAALAGFGDLLVQASGYADVSTRIQQIRRILEMEDLLKQAISLEILGLEAQAIDRYDQVQKIDLNYKRPYISSRLVALNLKLGLRIVEQNPPVLADLPAALAHFDAVLEQEPNHPEASQQRRLLRFFLNGKKAADERRWHDAADNFRVPYETKPDYLAGAVLPLFYDALIGSGDLYRDGGDIYRAYDQYSRACLLPVPDYTLCRGRLAEVVPLMTPTPTPTLTPTPVPTAVPVPSATATPTPTPRPLDLFRNRILFKSDNPDQPGYYVMDSDGSNRDYLGPFQLYDKQVEALREQERFSPDGRYRVYTADLDGRAQIYIEYPDTGGGRQNRPLTRLTGIAYDPVWAPDGSGILFVTQENESDDIWIVSPDAERQEALVRNDWEWDKHPTWSPDSTRIAFMSNREGAQQIFIMDRNGRNPRNISRVEWAEYDPIWVK
jgi:tetratricopeptide (TPR) repeat protein